MTYRLLPLLASAICVLLGMGFDSGFNAAYGTDEVSRSLPPNGEFIETVRIDGLLGEQYTDATLEIITFSDAISFTPGTGGVAITITGDSGTANGSMLFEQGLFDSVPLNVNLSDALSDCDAGTNCSVDYDILVESTGEADATVRFRAQVTLHGGIDLGPGVDVSFL